jgi:hypothetical protein
MTIHIVRSSVMVFGAAAEARSTDGIGNQWSIGQRPVFVQIADNQPDVRGNYGKRSPFAQTLIVMAADSEQWSNLQKNSYSTLKN